MLYFGGNGSWPGVFKPGWLYCHSLRLSHQESAVICGCSRKHFEKLCPGDQFSSFQLIHSVMSICDPMDCSTQGLPVHHQHPKFTQTHVHWVGDAIQPLHPLSSPSPPALNLSQHQGLFKWVSSSHQVAKILEFQLQHQSFQWIIRTDFL